MDTTAPRPRRVLLLSAAVGASHGAMARALEAQLHAADPAVHTTLRNDFGVLGPLLERVLGGGFRFHLTHAPSAYGLTYRVFMRSGAACRAGEACLEMLGGRALLDLIARHRPDVVVSTYPVLNALLGRLRARGRLPVPACGVVGPLAGLRFWSHPGLDLHLAMYEDAIAEIERLAGPRSAVPIRPLVDERFYAPLDTRDARAALGLPAGERIALVSGGGWGAGDLATATAAVLDAGVDRAVVLAGRDPQPLAARFRGDARVDVRSFTDRMNELLAAADVFVTATGGTSCIEARLRGCPTVCFGFLVGHVRDNASAQAAHGMLQTARSRRELTAAVARALRGGRRPIPPLAELPRAAELVLAVEPRAWPPMTSAARSRPSCAAAWASSPASRR